MHKPRIFLLSGTPGTGKTSLAHILRDKYGYLILSLGEAVIQNNLYSADDPTRDTKIVDPNKLDRFFDEYYGRLSRDVLVECHYADMIAHPAIELAIVLRCHPNILRQRLCPRTYHPSKIAENDQAEFFGDSTSFMLEKLDLVQHKRIFEIDTSKDAINDIAEEINQIIQNPENFTHKLAGRLSWLSDDSVSLEGFYEE